MEEDVPAMLKEIREILGISQSRLAIKLDINPVNVNRWENGRVKPTKCTTNLIKKIHTTAKKKQEKLDKTKQVRITKKAIDDAVTKILEGGYSEYEI